MTTRLRSVPLEPAKVGQWRLARVRGGRAMRPGRIASKPPEQISVAVREIAAAWRIAGFWDIVGGLARAGHVSAGTTTPTTRIP